MDYNKIIDAIRNMKMDRERKKNHRIYSSPFIDESDKNKREDFFDILQNQYDDLINNNELYDWNNTDSLYDDIYNDSTYNCSNTDSNNKVKPILEIVPKSTTQTSQTSQSYMQNLQSQQLKQIPNLFNFVRPDSNIKFNFEDKYRFNGFYVDKISINKNNYNDVLQCFDADITMKGQVYLQSDLENDQNNHFIGGENNENNINNTNKKQIIKETYHDYLTMISIKNHDSTKLNPEERWIYNLLDGVSDEKSKTFKIIYSDSDFLIITWNRWNFQDKSILNKTNINLMAIPRDKNLRCLRSITGQNISLLDYIKKKTESVVENFFGIPKNQLRMWIEYTPDFYHLHIKIANCNNKNILLFTDGEHHDLDTIIFNLSIKSDYYQCIVLNIKK